MSSEDCVCQLYGPEPCGAVRPREHGVIAYQCTREAGHDGEHVTCFVGSEIERHRLAEWPQEGEE